MSAQSKSILLLSALIAVCLLMSVTHSLHNSHAPSASMQLSVPIEKVCKIPLKIVESCEEQQEMSGSRDSCDKELSLASQCKHIAKEAYYQMNVGGCSNEMLLASVCKKKWCSSELSLVELQLCLQECGTLQDKVRQCERNHLVDAFRNADFTSELFSNE